MSDQRSLARLAGLLGTKRAAGAVAIAVAVYYAILGLLVLRPQAVYAGDIGVKYVQAQALVANRFRSLDIPYSGEFLDPERRFQPLRPPFVMFVGDTTQAIFPPASTVFQAVAVAFAGFRGMVLLTVLAAAVVLFAVRRLSPARHATYIVLTVGLASPLWFYAISGWEHAPGIALGVLGFALVMGGRPDETRITADSSRIADARESGGDSTERERSRKSADHLDPDGTRSVGDGASRPVLPVLAGLAVGAGATIRDEVILLVPGLLLAVWITRRQIRPVVLTVAGTVVPLILAMALEVWWFERPAAAHLRHAVHVLQAALNTSNTPNPDVPVLRPMTERQKYEAVVQYWILGYGNDRWIVTFAAAAALALAVRWLTGSATVLLLWLAGIIGLALIDWRELMTAPKWLAGLQRVAPYLVFALFPRPRGSVGGNSLQPIMLGTAGAYLVLAFIGADTHGGKSLGPRLLMPLLPLLAVPAVMQIRAYTGATRRVERWIGYGGILLVLLSLTMHLFGTTRAYIFRNNDDASAIVALAESRARIVVSDDMYTAQLLMPLYRRKVILLADSQPLATELGTVLSNQRIAEVVLVSRHPERLITLSPPLRLDRSEIQGRMVLHYYRR